MSTNSNIQTGHVSWSPDYQSKKRPAIKKGDIAFLGNQPVKILGSSELEVIEVYDLKTAAANLDAALEKAQRATEHKFPTGTTIRCKISGGEHPTWITAKVIGHTGGRQPFEIVVENTKTGSQRYISAHPDSWHKVQIIEPEQE